MTLGIGAPTEAPAQFALSFVLNGEPIPKQRARVTKFGTYTPAKTRAYQTALAHAGKIAMAGREPADTALVVTVQACLPIPRSWTAQKRRSASTGVIRPAVMPDADNYLKTVMDGLNGIVWTDDGRIVSASIDLWYSAIPLLRIQVQEWRG